MIVAALWLRLAHPAGDAHPWAYTTDEGTYSYAARNAIKHGSWFPDEAKYALVTPLFSAGQFLLAKFLAWPSDIVRYRAVSILSGFLSALLLSLMIEGRGYRLAATSLGLVSFIGIVHSRMAIAEPMLTLFLQLTVLAAWQALRGGGMVFSILAGMLSFACFLIKPNGLFIVAVPVLAPFICSNKSHFVSRYMAGLVGGMLIVASLWIVFIGLPLWAEWKQMNAALTSYAISNMSFHPHVWFGSAINLMMDPSLHTMPFLWPFALAWCLNFIWRFFRGREREPMESLLFLWLILGLGMLSPTQYHPARWLLVLFPPILIAGLRFLQQKETPRALAVSVLGALLFSAVYSKYVFGRFLETGGFFYPVFGLFSHVLPAAFTILVLGGCYGVYFLLFGSSDKKAALLTSVVALEIILQFSLQAMPDMDRYRSLNPWREVAKDVESRLKEDDVISGDLVQDFALYSDLRVLPTYLLLDETDDTSVRRFFLRQNIQPTHFVLVGFKIPYWREHMPDFMGRLDEAGTYNLHVGGTGRQIVYIYKIRSDPSALVP